MLRLPCCCLLYPLPGRHKARVRLLLILAAAVAIAVAVAAVAPASVAAAAVAAVAVAAVAAAAVAAAVVCCCMRGRDPQQELQQLFDCMQHQSASLYVIFFWLVLFVFVYSISAVSLYLLSI